MTSVKEFRIDREPTPDELGRGSFVFTDQYSVFDWGEMPDLIPQKGASLCTMGAYNFEQLEAAGIPTHYRGVVTEGNQRSLEETLDDGTAPREMAIDLTTVPELPFENGTYDYDAYHGATGKHYLVPLEIVFRNTVPIGSSLRGRYSPAELGLDRSSWPDEPIELPDPVVEFSTKFERQDRYLDREEAAQIAGEAPIDELESTAAAVNAELTAQASVAGFAHQDGKIECLYDRRSNQVVVADVVGTFDENRFAYQGQQISKEVLRQYHKRTQPEWVEAVSAAKAQATSEGIADWKSLCEKAPAPLDEHVIEAARDLYCAGTNAFIGRDVFDAPSLEDAIEHVQAL